MASKIMQRFNIKLLHPLFIYLLTLSVYIFFAGRLNFSFPVSIYNYFSYLTEAFLHGSLAFISHPPYLHDLTTVNNNIYMYWGPAPTLVILPFIIFFGRGISDALYTSIIAATNPLIMYFILQQVQKLKIVNIPNYKKAILCIFFAFGTVHFYLSITGAVWFTSQVISVFYLLVGILCITKFSHSKSLITLITSLIFFALAVNGRTTLVFYAPLFLSFLILPYLKGKARFKSFLISLTVFALMGAILFIFNSFYNYLRFGSILDNGYPKMHTAAHFAEDLQEYGNFNPAYISKNFYHMFINFPTSSRNFPFFAFDTEGNSLLFTSPLFLMLILIARKKYWKTVTLKLVNLSSLICSFILLIFLLLFFGTGWVQFGYRYILDIIPILILLLAEVIAEVPFLLIIILVIISILVNLLGSLWFISL